MQQNQVQFILAAVDQATAVLRSVEASVKGLDTTTAGAARGGMASFNSQANAINSTLTAIVGGAAFQRFLGFIQGTAVESNQAAVDMGLFEKQLERNNISIAEGTEVLGSLATRLKVLPETLSGNVTQLLRQGLAMDEISKLYQAGAASALAAGKTTSIGIEAVTQAVVNQSSIYLNQAGIAENVVNFLNAEAKARGVVRDELSKEQTARAIVNGILGVTAEEVSDLDRMLGGLTGSQSDLTNTTQLLRLELGEAFLPVVQLTTNALTAALNVVRSIPAPIQIAITVFAGLTAAAVAITGVLGTLTIAVGALGVSMATVFGPAAIIAGAIGLVVALNGHMQDLEVTSDEVADSFDRSVESAAPMNEALLELTKSTNREGLQGAVEALAATLDTTGKTSMLNWARDTLPAIMAQGTLQDAILASIQKFSELETAANATEIKGLQNDQATLLNEQLDLTKELIAQKEQLKRVDGSGTIAEHIVKETVAGLEQDINSNIAKVSALNQAMVNLSPAQAALVKLYSESEKGAYDSAEAIKRLEEIIGGRLNPTTETAGDTQDTNAEKTGKATQAVRTYKDVLDDYWKSLEQVTRMEDERGDGYDELIEQLNLEKRVYDELVKMDAPAELTRQFAQSIAKLEGMTKDLDLTVEVGVTFDAEKAKRDAELAMQEAFANAPGVARYRAVTQNQQASSEEAETEERNQLRIQQANWLKSQSFVTGAEIRNQAYLDNAAAAAAEAEAEEQAALRTQQARWLVQQSIELPGVARGQAEANARAAAAAEATAEEQGAMRAQAARYVAQQGIQSGVELRYAAYQANAAAAEAEAEAEERAQLRILQAGIHQLNPLPGPSNSTQMGGYFSQMAGDTIDYAGAAEYAESAQRALNNSLEQANRIMGIAPTAVQVQIASLEELKQQYPEFAVRIDEMIAKLEEFGEKQAAINAVTGALQGVITISRAVGNAFGGDVGKMAKAIEETAQIAMNAVKAIASGDPIAIAAAAIEAIGFIAREIVEATTNYIDQAADEIAQRYELLSEESAEAIVNANKKLETKFFLFIPYQVEVPDQPAVDAAVKMANSFAEGLKSHLASSDAEWSQFVTDWVNDRILTLAVQAQAIGEITNMVNEALKDGEISDGEWAAIFDKANIARENAIRDAERRGYRAPAADPAATKVPDEVSLGTVSHSIQLAIATPMLNAMNTLHSSVLIFDKATNRHSRSVDKFTSAVDKFAKMPPPTQDTGGKTQAIRF
jgi:hypothetical protein